MFIQTIETVKDRKQYLCIVYVWFKEKENKALRKVSPGQIDTGSKDKKKQWRKRRPAGETAGRNRGQHERLDENKDERLILSSGRVLDDCLFSAVLFTGSSFGKTDGCIHWRAFLLHSSKAYKRLIPSFMCGKLWLALLLLLLWRRRRRLLFWQTRSGLLFLIEYLYYAAVFWECIKLLSNASRMKVISWSNVMCLTQPSWNIDGKFLSVKQKRTYFKCPIWRDPRSGAFWGLFF